MKKLVLVLIGFMVMPVLAVPTIEFSPFTGGWSYDGAGTISFTPVIDVDRGLGSPFDTLAGAYVHLPNFTVTGSGGSYTLTPLGYAQITITDSTNTIVYLTGTLGVGDMVTGGTAATGYTNFQTDITNVVITNNGTLGSLALASITVPDMDFELSFQGVSSGFAWMLDTPGATGSDGFSGAMTVVPAPGAILLGSIGVSIVGWLRKRRTL